MIHEFAKTVGKENFYLIGEITGGRQRAFNTLELTGLDGRVYAPGRRLTCLYSSDTAQIGQSLEVQPAGGRLAVRLSLPAAGFAVYE